MFSVRVLEFLYFRLQGNGLGGDDHDVTLVVAHLDEVDDARVLELKRRARAADLTHTGHVAELVEVPLILRKILG